MKLFELRRPDVIVDEGEPAAAERLLVNLDLLTVMTDGGEDANAHRWCVGFASGEYFHVTEDAWTRVLVSLKE